MERDVPTIAEVLEWSTDGSKYIPGSFGVYSSPESLADICVATIVKKIHCKMFFEITLT
jgi:hypothetical protein